MEIDLGVFVTYVGVIILFFVFGKLFFWPLKTALKLTFNSLLGGLLLLAINAVGAAFNIFIPVNVLNACIVGILGLPGVIMLFILTT